MHYAKDNKARSAPELRRVGEPLPRGPRSGRAQPLPDRLAYQRGQDHQPSYGGHRILQGLDPATRSALQRRWTAGPWRPSSPKPRRQGSGAAHCRATGGTRRGAKEASQRRRDVELQEKVGEWIEEKTGKKARSKKQRGWEYLRRLGNSPKVPRPHHALANKSEQEAFKKDSR
jgi:hypothetical protein